MQLLLLALASLAADRPDMLVADFEGETYGEWKTTGIAFGKGPARGTLPNQMPVTGFLGKGLVNSYNGGDGSTGTLTSPAFKIERRYLNFLIGGGMNPGKTCINLLVDGKIVRTATGPNGKPGGSEQLDWHAWDVAEFEGKSAVIEIIDQATGGWGHINIDHIIQSDKKRGTVLVRREIEIGKRYLNLPVMTGAPKKRMRFLVGGETVREFEIELAEDKPDFWAFSDVSAFRGKKLVIETQLASDSKALEKIAHADEIAGAADLYNEKHRPQFHFTSRRGWLNDPNGLVYADGEYHLFYQHNPYGWNWGNMHWGHAVSTDLHRWRELPVALYPHKFGDWAFSGSSVVDKDNTSGWKKSADPLLVLAFTSTGRGECIAYSNDLGRSWTEFEGNPVVKHRGRDPKLIWHKPSKNWLMAVYDEHAGKQWIAFHTSPDLKKWTFQSRIEGFYECPDLFSLPIENDPGKSKWVLYAADGQYILGDFDGKTFVKESGKHRLWYGNFYAAQSFDNAPDGQRIQIGWNNGAAFPGMPFNQQMTFPCLLTLKTTQDGVRLFAQPYQPIRLFDGKPTVLKNQALKPGDNLLSSVRNELLAVHIDFRPKEAEQVTLTLRGVPAVYDVMSQTITCQGVRAPLLPNKGHVTLYALVDRGSIELFGNKGEVALSVAALLSIDNTAVSVSAKGGEVDVAVLFSVPLKSSWKKKVTP